MKTACRSGSRSGPGRIGPDRVGPRTQIFPLTLAGTGGGGGDAAPRVFRGQYANGSADRHETWYRYLTFEQFYNFRNLRSSVFLLVIWTWIGVAR